MILLVPERYKQWNGCNGISHCVRWALYMTHGHTYMANMIFSISFFVLKLAFMCTCVFQFFYFIANAKAWTLLSLSIVQFWLYILYYTILVVYHCLIISSSRFVTINHFTLITRKDKRQKKNLLQRNSFSVCVCEWCYIPTSDPIFYLKLLLSSVFFLWVWHM